MGVEINIPDDFAERIMAQLQPIVDAALSVSEQVPTIIKDYAILQNQDVDGNQMSSKKPRPKRNPSNFPNVALVQNDDPDLMNPARWKHERTGPYEETVTYTPPEHLEYLLSKAPEDGGRPWIAYDRINASAQAEIQAEMVRRATGAAS